MGGHGGLNILPQKSWNVWRQDNREKVRADERKAKAEEDKARAKHEQAEREFRRNLLLKRAEETGRVPQHGALDSTGGLLQQVGGEEDVRDGRGGAREASRDAERASRRKGERDAARRSRSRSPHGHGRDRTKHSSKKKSRRRSASPEGERDAGRGREEARATHHAHKPRGGFGEHINLFDLNDLDKAGDADKLEKEREERRRRGKADTRTADPRFDEQFQLGYKMGREHAPWYASAGGPADAPAPAKQLKRSYRGAGKVIDMTGGHVFAHGGATGGGADPSGADDSGRRTRGPKSIEQLRAERLVREKAERAKARALVGREPGHQRVPPSRRYL
ncbi:unnamed protein product [Pedinophyceae sp. YPF-701]|nr:unnamed protein product [Pedinophyceae sp. YPF-701]